MLFRIFVNRAGLYTLAALLLAFYAALLQASDEVGYQTVAGADGVPLNVAIAGNPNAPGVLLIHGIGQSHASFRRQLESSLSDDFYLVAFDLRGHGNSAKPWDSLAYTRSETWAEDVHAVIAATGLVKPVVVAWSYGTLVLADYLREFGVGNIGAINFVGSFGGMIPMEPPDDPELMKRFSSIRRLQLSASVADNTQAAEQSVDWLTHDAMAPDAFQLAVRVNMMLPSYVRRALVTRHFDNRDLVGALSMPTLISMGEHDPSTPRSAAEALVGQLPDGETSYYAGAGHSVFVEAPDRFNRELRRLIVQSCEIPNQCGFAERR